MASQVLNGLGNVNYTNNTGQNVRIVINFMSSYSVSRPLGGGTVDHYITVSWPGGSASNTPSSASGQPAFAIGRNIAFANYTSPSNQSVNLGTNFIASQNMFYPTEIMISPGQSFSARCGAYNIVVIPENG